MIVLHDIHAGANRASGTTLASRLALRHYILDEFRALATEAVNRQEDLMILGDLFDTSQVPLYDVQEVRIILESVLERGRRVFLVPGNHDLSKNSTSLSSFDFMARDLFLRYPHCYVVNEPGFLPVKDGIASEVYVIPHLVNQVEFTRAVAEVPKCAVLALHCNYDNGFAARSDHSLNLSKLEAEGLLDRVGTILIAHEHQARTMLDGRVVIPGNQIPSSISDCLNCDGKNFSTINFSGAVQQHLIANIDQYYLEVPWREAANLVDHPPFLRLVGDVLAGEVDQAMAVLSETRARLEPALVVAASYTTADAEDAVADVARDMAGINVEAELLALVADRPEQYAMLVDAIHNLPQHGEQ